MPWYVYILVCSDNSFYIGHTDDIDERIKRHNEGRGAVWTACRRPVKLIYHETFSCELDAISRELQLKKWSRRKKEALVTGNLHKLKFLSKCRNSK